MVRKYLPRLPILRAIVPRASAPLLPTSRARPSALVLTNTPRTSTSRLFHYFPARLSSTPKSPVSPRSQPDPRTTLPPDATISQRLRHLIKSYGWYALAVYVVLSVLDFGVAFVGINLLGAEYVSQIAASVKAAIANVYSKPVEPGMDEMESVNHGGGNSHEGLYAMLVLAYTVHKTLFLPVRVGMTAAFTPRIVGWLSQRGWSGGAGTRRAATEMRDRLRERRNGG